MAKITGSPENIATYVVGVPVQQATKLIDARPGRKSVVLAYTGISFYIGSSSAVTASNGLIVNESLQIETEAEIWAYISGGTGTKNIHALETYD